MARISETTKVQVRERLLTAAARLFADRGLAGANIDDVATSAGFGKGTVYNYFPSKEALFAAVIEEGCRRAVERWSSVPRAASVRADLRALAAADVAVLLEDEGFTQVLVREALAFRTETYPLVVEHLGPYLTAVEDALTVGLGRGEVRADVPVARARARLRRLPHPPLRPALGERWRMADARRAPGPRRHDVPRRGRGVPRG